MKKKDEKNPQKSAQAAKRKRRKKMLHASLLSLLLLLGASIAMISACSGTRYSGARQKAVESSPQWKDGRFANTLSRRDSPIMDMVAKHIKSSEQMVPAGEVPIVPLSRADFEAPPQSGLRATWLGHSTVLIEIGGYRVLTDPVWSERVSPVSGIGPKRFFPPPLPLEELADLDAVVISHNHYDHLDKMTIQALAGRTKFFAVPLGVGALLEEWGVEPGRIRERDWWGEAKLGDLTLTATPARHFSGRSLVRPMVDDTLWCGWAVATPQHRVFYSGDGAMFPGFAEIGERLGPFELSLMECGAYDSLWPDVHLGPEQALTAHRMVRGKVLMPVHWGTFNLANHGWTEPAERVRAACGNEDVELAIPRPGQSVEPASLPELVRWWPENHWQTAEEHPVVSTGLASPAAICAE